MYKTNDEIYLKDNESQWIKKTETNYEYSQSDTSYSNVAKSLDSVHDLVEVVETEDENDFCILQASSF